MFQKRKRIEDPELLAEVRKSRCCVKGCFNQAEAAHVKSRGSGGDDVATNVMPLCTWHHAEQHNLGWSRFRERHPEVRTWAEIKRGAAVGEV